MEKICILKDIPKGLLLAGMRLTTPHTLGKKLILQATSICILFEAMKSDFSPRKWLWTCSNPMQCLGMGGVIRGACRLSLKGMAIQAKPLHFRTRLRAASITASAGNRGVGLRMSDGFLESLKSLVHQAA